MKMKLIKVTLAILATIVTSQTLATPLGAGGIVTPVPITGLPGTVPIANLTDPFANFLYSGEVETWVFDDAAYNAAGLTFVYQVRLNPNVGIAETIRRHADFGWDGFTSDVSQNDSGGSLQTVESADRSADGSTLGWNWVNGDFEEGEDGALLIVKTDANWYKPSVGGVIDGIAANVDIYAPATQVPDGGSTAILLGAALMAVGLIRRRIQ